MQYITVTCTIYTRENQEITTIDFRPNIFFQSYNICAFLPKKCFEYPYSLRETFSFFQHRIK